MKSRLGSISTVRARSTPEELFLYTESFHVGPWGVYLRGDPITALPIPEFEEQYVYSNQLNNRQR